MLFLWFPLRFTWQDPVNSSAVAERKRDFCRIVATRRVGGTQRLHLEA